MGSEDLFHKRKARNREDTKRKIAKRQPYDYVLITTEGEKTEPIYFKEAIRELDIDSANVQIDGSCGSSPLSVFQHAETLFNKEKNCGGHYDKVFCVFDKDTHATFEEAIDKIKSINSKLKKEEYSKIDVFHAIYSIPSFEYWLLLHYTPTTKPFLSCGKKSAGDRVISDLKNYLPNYKKECRGLYKNSIEQGTLAIAVAQSDRILTQANRTGNTNPCTTIHILVKYLQEIKSQ